MKSRFQAAYAGLGGSNPGGRCFHEASMLERFALIRSCVQQSRD